MKNLMFFAFITISCSIILIGILSSFVPLVYLFTSTAHMEKQSDNSTDIQNSFYNNFQGGIYSLADGQTSPNGKWQAVYTGDGTLGVARDNATSGCQNQ